MKSKRAFTIAVLPLIALLSCGSPQHAPITVAPVVPTTSFIYVSGSLAPGEARNQIGGFRFDPDIASLSPQTVLAVSGEIDGLTTFRDMVFVSSYDNSISSQATSSLAAWRVDQSSGQLSRLYSSSYVAGQLAIDPSGHFLYATTQTDIAAFAVDSKSGLLTPLPGSPYATVRGAAYPAISPDGNWLCGGGFFRPGRVIQCYARDPSTGIIRTGAGNEVTDYKTGVGGLKFLPSGLIAAEFYNFNNGGTPTIFLYRIAPEGLTVVSTTPSPGPDPVIAAVDPTGKYLVVSDDDFNLVTLYTVDASAGTLTVATQVALKDGQPYRGVFSTDGKRVAILLFASSKIAFFDLIDGQLKATSPATLDATSLPGDISLSDNR